MRVVLLLLLTLAVGGCLSASDIPEDPWEERIRGREPPSPEDLERSRGC